MTVSVKSNKWPYLVKERIDPNAVLNYGIDWSDWVPTGYNVVVATWTIAGGTEVHSAIIDNVTYVWLSVEDADVTEVEATVHVTLDTVPIALEDDRTLILTVQER